MLTKNQLRIKILPEKEKDFEDINKLLIEAFKDEEHSSHDENKFFIFTKINSYRKNK